MSKKRKTKIIDEYAEREAKKYERPIPSREFILSYLQERDSPVKREELIQELNLESEEEQEALRRRLRAMERDGQLILTRRGGYGLPQKMNLIRGRVIGHKDGFGFLTPEDGSNDLFLNAYQMRMVFHGDRVLARVSGIDRRGRREAAIVEVLEHTLTSIVGRFFSESGLHYVVPDNKRINQNIVISPGEEAGAENGQIVVAQITTPPTYRSQAVGKIIEVLGEHLAPGMEIDISVRSFNIPHIWPEEVLTEIASMQAEVSDFDKKNRLDIRHLPLVTIDGEDAKDFDDAVFCEKQKGGGWTLYVAIADVSHYVKLETALDAEAKNRGTSVYFPGFVVPMLPELLSNGLCSLKADVDRLCMVCEISISRLGKLNDYKFYSAVMRSKARLTYTNVTNWLLDPKNIPNQYASLLPVLEELFNLYEVLRKKREARGAIDFDTVETRIIFGEERKIQEIIPYERTVSHRIIEECMLLANVAAADFMLQKKMPILFRIHAGPEAAKLQELRDFLAELGLRLPGRKIPKPDDYTSLLKSVRERPDAHIIQVKLLRSLSQAVYSPENIGHFGLAYPAYTHFTSPIRRYPDLLLHRAIKHVLAKGKVKDFSYDRMRMVELGEHCSITERRADEATRDVLDWLKCEYIKDRVGDEFEGIVTNVTGFGLFLELKDIYVEGLLHVTSLKNDYYSFDPIRHQLRGDRSGIIYHLGSRLKVRIARVNLENRQIDFDFMDSLDKTKHSKKSGSNVKVKNKKGPQQSKKAPRKRK